MHGENDDGCVPRTPTLTSGAGVSRHPGKLSGNDGCAPRTPALTSGAGVRPHPGKYSRCL